ncbi:MAG: tRNA (guanosine(37)-N1)-methyltransferase TrmD [Bacteriovoracaceae bacterium]|nr:tRNA (guanosine(37)-N1)-methyltransferase TrmD [Bacteriovoracaceae bacterium]
MITRRIWIMTLFPEFFKPLLECGVAGQALRGERAESIKFDVRTVNVRDWGMGNYQAVDDTPYGGGPGMVMRADVLARAFHEGIMIPGGYQNKNELNVIYTGPRGTPWNNRVARDFGEKTLTDKDVVFVCGRYEGIDERFLTHYVDHTFSLGDYVLTGGELAVMTMLDSSVRFVPGILGNKSSANEDSFEDGLLECPQFTKPREFEGESVPEVLANGNHAKIKEWQQEQKEMMTKKLRPDLWQKKN